ncbi:MAG: methyl-accepting chemotaxis protein [Eubacterium sp.]|nr:methyl-accepting chemotaxis protein [Eubacterium sp.]MCM1216384.1 methyl-accepting chemotaxis protein [Lachnospiraceae bacterium]MCM1303432.1 methyl-accepting chemotaxis protein [Butyrivibrio sp.]MCM1345162.1 methyl-accepting chemotaxis protein [Muribaculaceae bacterium]MCM1238234.1 methyl-accepting chemotaxis protein [Lachnospiraceae bacterium]
MKKKKVKSLVFAIMRLCIGVALLVAIVVGGVAILSINTLSQSSYLAYETTVDEGYQTEIKSQVQSTMAILQSEYDKFQAGEKTEEEAKYDAGEIIRAMRYRDDQSGYFWIDDTEYTLVMHPILVENEGANRYTLEDQNGVMIVQEIMKVCQTPEKGGFNEFYFTKSDGVTVAPKLAYSEIFEPWGWVVSTGNYIDDMNMEKADMREYLDNAYQTVLTRVNITSVCTMLVALIAAFIVGKSIVAPLKKIQEFASRISEGNLTTNVDVKSKSEIGQTADSLRVAQENMRQLLLDITDVSQGVNGALEKFDTTFRNMKESISQVSLAAESIAENVTTQAGSTDDASRDVNVMADRISQTGTEVENLDQNAKEMSQISERSMNTLKQLIEVNNKTRQSILEMTEQTAHTHESAQQIHVAANLINEISDQTALLALNASIEAARAGEAGRGFAVVADEIGRLANQSAESVVEINRVVEELQENASKSVEAMQEINIAVDQQVESLTETQDVFSKLHHELNACLDSVKMIDGITVELEGQRSNVTHSLEVLSRLAQDNAAVAEETSAMSTELTRVADDSTQIVAEMEDKVSVLVENVHKFTL